jgi:hypothetical protein
MPTQNPILLLNIENNDDYLTSLFVLFVHQVEVSQTMAPLVTILYHWKALDKVQVPGDGFLMFQSIVDK